MGQQGRTEAIVAELQKVGLDAKVMCILLGHGQGDHFAGAAYFQEHYGARVGTSAADWDLMYPVTGSSSKHDSHAKSRPETGGSFSFPAVPRPALVAGQPTGVSLGAYCLVL